MAQIQKIKYTARQKSFFEINTNASLNKSESSQLKADSREGVDHGSDRRLVPGADVVKVKHALHSPRLHAPNQGLCVLGKEVGCFGYGQKWEREKTI